MAEFEVKEFEGKETVGTPKEFIIYSTFIINWILYSIF